MSQYAIHPIVMGTKIFDKGMMAFQHDYGKPYTIPIHEPKFASRHLIP
jgi:hypothetical protein